AAGAAVFAFGALYALYLFLSQHRASPSGLGLAVSGLALFAAGRMARPIRPSAWFAGVVLLGMAIQFGAFWFDYFGAYRVRSAPWLSGNLSGALEALIRLDQETPAPGVYFTVLRDSSGR